MMSPPSSLSFLVVVFFPHPPFYRFVVYNSGLTFSLHFLPPPWCNIDVVHSWKYEFLWRYPSSPYIYIFLCHRRSGKVLRWRHPRYVIRVFLVFMTDVVFWVAYSACFYFFLISDPFPHPPTSPGTFVRSVGRREVWEGVELLTWRHISQGESATTVVVVLLWFPGNFYWPLYFNPLLRGWFSLKRNMYVGKR